MELPAMVGSDMDYRAGGGGGGGGVGLGAVQVLLPLGSSGAPFYSFYTLQA